ncbi:hypothetical protein HDU96_004751 [Phlyctochytrium bullatum]|nr:hypothetical protein HDU96_004751 [Phlyctochytrium bullatum]
MGLNHALAIKPPVQAFVQLLLDSLNVNPEEQQCAPLNRRLGRLALLFSLQQTRTWDTVPPQPAALESLGNNIAQIVLMGLNHALAIKPPVLAAEGALNPQQLMAMMTAVINQACQPGSAIKTCMQETIEAACQPAGAVCGGWRNL